MDRVQIVQMLRAANVPIGEGMPDFTDMATGRVAVNVLRFQTAGRHLVVKEVRENEARILKVLHHLSAEVAPTIRFPALLSHHLLVWDYVDGTRPGVHLHPSTAAAYARLQNALDTPQVLEELGLLGECVFNRTDDGFYRSSFTRCVLASEISLQMAGHLGSPLLSCFQALFERIRAREEELAEQFSGAPFGWLHHDFRDANLVGWPQKLIDWGSSYGYGPFLFDIAPYLLENPDALEAFAAASVIWQRGVPERNRGFLLACACAAFLGFLTWHLRDHLNASEEEAARNALARKWRQFGVLDAAL